MSALAETIERLRAALSDWDHADGCDRERQCDEAEEEGLPCPGCILDCRACNCGLTSTLDAFADVDDAAKATPDLLLALRQVVEGSTIYTGASASTAALKQRCRAAIEKAERRPIAGKEQG